MVPTLCANTTGPVAGVVVADGVADAVGEGEAVAAGPAWLPQAATKPAVLYEPRDAYRMRYSYDAGFGRSRGPWMPHYPPPGAMLDYYLSSAPAGSVILDITDSTGKYTVWKLSPGEIERRTRNLSPARFSTPTQIWPFFARNSTVTQPPPATQSAARSSLPI